MFGLYKCVSVCIYLEIVFGIMLIGSTRGNEEIESTNYELFFDEIYCCWFDEI